jgi:hypothetical protein
MVSSGPMANAVDRHGVRVTRTRRGARDVWLVAAAGTVVVVVALTVHGGRRPSTPTPPGPPTPSGSAATRPDAEPADPHAAAPRDPSAPLTRAAAIRALRRAGIEPERGADGHREYDGKRVIEALHAAGVHEGIGAFNPPGTNPPKPGLVVPDDFVLPEGYVRYYQTTDDGEQLPPVLMFHPDFEFFDADGRRIEVPDDRIVPAALAPPGLPVRMLDVPGRDSSR